MANEFPTQSCSNDTESSFLLEVNNLDIVVEDGKEERTLSSGICFDLPQKKILPLIGPSGIGKSTLLRAIVRLHPAKEGCLFYRGQDIRLMSPVLLRRKIGLLLQKPSFLHGTVEENLLDAFTFKSVDMETPNKAAINDILDRVSMPTTILDKDVSTLSGGEAQRIALARLMLLKPEVLLLDEPTSNLDEESSSTIVRSIKQWSEETQGSAIWIVHERSVLKELGEKAILFTREGILTDSSEWEE